MYPIPRGNLWVLHRRTIEADDRRPTSSTAAVKCPNVAVSAMTFFDFDLFFIPTHLPYSIFSSPPPIQGGRERKIGGMREGIISGWAKFFAMRFCKPLPVEPAPLPPLQHLRSSIFRHSGFSVFVLFFCSGRSFVNEAVFGRFERTSAFW